MTSRWVDLPQLGIDLETTGLDVTQARIVTAATVSLSPAGTSVTKTAYIADPGIDIPEQAAEVHGITTEYAREHGDDYLSVYTAVRTALEAHWATGCAVVAYNAAYDLSIVHWEGLRLGWPPLDPGIVIDPLVIDRQLMRGKGAERSRKLKVTADHHRVRLDVEHDAIEDVLATLRILWRIRSSPVGGWSTDRLMQEQERWYRIQQDRYADGSSEWPVRRTA